MNHLSGGTSGAWGISVGYKSNNSSLGGSENAGQGTGFDKHCSSSLGVSQYQ